MGGLGIIIVTYNSAKEIGPCLDAAIATGAEIVVVDNASEDDTVAEVKRRNVKLIANPKNRGFAGGVNQGFDVLNTTYVLLLNPDCVVIRGLEALCEACDLPGSAGAGGKLVGADGQPQTGFMVRQLPGPAALVLEALLLNRIWPNNPVNRRYRVWGEDYSRRFAVEQPAGAFLMIRREVWQELGGFDEGFFPVWFEDVDFCRRIQQRGLNLYYVPEAVAKHTGGHSIPHLGVEMRPVYWYRSLLRYSAKHFRPRAFRGVCAAVFLGSIIRGITESVMRRSLRPIFIYGMVLRQAWHCMVFGFRP